MKKKLDKFKAITYYNKVSKRTFTATEYGFSLLDEATKENCIEKKVTVKKPKVLTNES